MTLAELSDRSKVETWAIREYLAQGLLPLPPGWRGSLEQQAFDQDHLERLQFISASLEEGFALEVITDILDG